jgi:hypothetical protein
MDNHLFPESGGSIWIAGPAIDGGPSGSATRASSHRRVAKLATLVAAGFLVRTTQDGRRVRRGGVSTMRANRNLRGCSQEYQARGTASSGGRQAPLLLLLGLVLALAGANIAGGAAQQEAPRTLAGVWRLHETRGELPEQAVRALDGRAGGGATVTIQVEQAAADVTVRRLGAPPVLLRVMPLSARAGDHQVPGGGLMSGRAEWKEDGALLANGHVTVKQGFLRRRVPFEEEWQLDEGGRMLTVTSTLKTPLGVKRRIQVFMRVTEDASGAGTESSAGDTPTRPKKFVAEVNADSHLHAPAFVGSGTRYAHRV